MPLPIVSTALDGWESPITISTIVQTIVDGRVSEVITNSSFQGVIQAFSPEMLSVKPLGERSWVWLQIHTKTNLVAGTNDRIIYNGKTFKIMEKYDRALNGYYEYHLVEDYV